MRRRTFLGYGAAALAAPLAGRIARAADPFVFLSTQLRPVEAAQQMRTVILKDFKGSADFVPEQPPEMVVRLKAEAQTNKHTISLVAGVHGELQPWCRRAF
jgi:multiple sugar transport system substrate-binding protein